MAKEKSFRSFHLAESCALRNAIERCERRSHPQYRDYGGRGITVATEFKEPITGFMAFFNEIGPRPSPDHSLDRIDNQKGYEPGNLRWATREEQAKSRRNHAAKVHDLGWGLGRVYRIDRHGIRRNRPSPLIPLDGEIKTVAAWALEIGLQASTITQRITSQPAFALLDLPTSADLDRHHQ